MISLGVATSKHAIQVSHANKPMPPDMQLDRVGTALQLPQLVREESRAAWTPREGVPLKSAPSSCLSLRLSVSQGSSEHRCSAWRAAIWSAPLTSVLSPELPEFAEGTYTPSAAASPRTAAEHYTIAFYDGADDSCSIRAEKFEVGDRVSRVRCRHIFPCGLLGSLSARTAAGQVCSLLFGTMWIPF